MRAGADPARLALSLSHVLCEVTYEEMVAGREDEPARVRPTLTTGAAVEYDAGLDNPFNPRRPGRRPPGLPLRVYCPARRGRHGRAAELAFPVGVRQP